VIAVFFLDNNIFVRLSKRLLPFNHVVSHAGNGSFIHPITRGRVISGFVASRGIQLAIVSPSTLRWILDGEIFTPRSIKAFLIALVCIEGSWEKIIVNLVPVLALVVPEKLCWQGDALFFRDSRSGVRLKVQRVTGSTIT
jgi:hypothetical protein